MSEPVPFAEANKPEPGSDTLPRDNNEVGSAATRNPPPRPLLGQSERVLARGPQL